MKPLFFFLRILEESQNLIIWIVLLQIPITFGLSWKCGMSIKFLVHLKIFIFNVE
jgi:hypothetical protein